MNYDGLVSHHKLPLDDVILHYVVAGDPQAPPMLMVHGWPQSWLEWAPIIPALAKHFRIIAPDLRGLGDSSAPQTGYDGKTVATDHLRLLDHLNIDTVKLVAHDMGTIGAYAFAAAYRERVSALAMLDTQLPGFSLEKMVQLGPQGWGPWHIPLHTSPMGELLITGKERDYLTWFFRGMAYDPNGIPRQHADEYIRSFCAPGAKRNLGHYAAMYENSVYFRELAKEKLTIPVLGLGGSFTLGNMVGEEMERVAENVITDSVPECGHWIPEEQPEWTAARLLSFFLDGK
jgi:pimeloyl-ACP methyl ester carboxylesterase